MDFDAEFAAAVADQRADRLEPAEQAYRAIVARKEHAPSLHNLGVILEDSGRLAEAALAFERAAAAAPDNPERLLILAEHYRLARRFAEGEPVYRRVLALAPDNDEAAHDLGLLLLATGRYAEGWALCERRVTRQRFLQQTLSFPEWRGEPLSGKRLFVWREQGFGDQIMMARFLSKLPAAQITYAGPAPLERLFKALPVDFMTFTEGALPIPRHDYWILPMSLPGRLWITGHNMPAEPYFFGCAKVVGGRIGVVWRGAPANANDRYRALPPDLAAELLTLPGAISLDPADTGAADFQATADIIAGLDLVITVDTAVAHLAGAMGRPVWVLLARSAIDWQWPREGASPWYPTARFFTQPTSGDWGSVIADVLRALAVI